MAGRYERSPGRWRRGRGDGPANLSAGRADGGGRWQWGWRRRHRRRRVLGCALWLLTLLIVLLVLSILFGGFRRGSKTGDGVAHVVRPAPVQALAR